MGDALHSVWGALPVALPVLVGLLGLLLGVRQLQRQRQAQGVERTIALHRDLTSGEVGAARERFTTAMWWVGRRSGPLCHQPRWPEIDDSPPQPGDISKYSEGVTMNSTERPLRDLYRVLYCFERIEATLEGKAIDERLAWELLAHHTVWWDCLTANIGDGSGDELGTRHICSLRHLAAWARDHEKEFGLPGRTDLTTWAAKDFARESQGTRAHPGS